MRIVFSFFVYILIYVQSFAQESVIYFNDNSDLNLNKSIKIFEDKTASLNLQQVYLIDTLFKKVDKGIANYGHSRSVFWAKFSVVNQLFEYPVLVLKPEWIPIVKVYLVKENKVLKELFIGAEIFKDERPVHISYPNVLLPLEKGEKYEVYIRFESSHIINFNFSLKHSEKCYLEGQLDYLFFYFFIGFLACVLVYNFVLSISTKGINNIYFIFYIILTMISTAYIKGFQPEILGKYMIDHCNIFTALMMIFLTLSIHKFTNLQSISIVLHRLRLVIILPLLAAIVLNVLDEVLISNALIINLAFLGALWGILVAIVLIKKSEKGASIIFTGFFTFIVGGILHILTIKGLLPLNVVTSNVYVLGSNFQVLFFSFYMASKLAYIRKQKEQAQKRVVSEIKKNEALILEQNAILEEKVEERTLQLKNQNKEINEKNKRITDGITYASYIQKAHLQEPLDLKKIVKDGFIFYKPKDILSGDFYFFTEINQYQFFIAADCTGHGVPGALLSITGHSLLREIILIEQIVKPNEIIARLNELFYKVLRQQDNLNRDGMDISVVVVDTELNKLFYAGAMNPLVYIQDDELNIIKGNRYSVGGDRHDLTFTLHEVDVKDGLMFFLYSDGFQDQFSHIDGSKFKGKTFRELLFQIANWSGREQFKKLEQTFFDWKGSEFQTDDVLVLGVRIK